MLKRRLIPVLFLQHGWMVRSELFHTHQVIGNPVDHVRRMAEWDVDELIVIDISEGEETQFRHLRDDYKTPGAEDLVSFVRLISEECRIPLTFGGRIRQLDDIEMRIVNGADKVCLNTGACMREEFINEAAKVFGSQAIVVNIDYRMIDDKPRVFTRHGKADASLAPADWARRAEELGAGEIFLQAIDRDGMACGYDLKVIDTVTEAVTIPVIACGGAGHQRHFAECYDKTSASAVAAGNIFHFTENAYPRAKQFLRGKRDDIR